MVADRVQQVGFSEPGGPVDEQRVVGTRRALGDRHRGRVREAVRRADDELVERVARIQRAWSASPRSASASATRRASSVASRRRARRSAGRARPAPRAGAWCRRATTMSSGTPVSAWAASVEQAEVAGAERSTATELGTPRIRVSSRAVEGVHPLEPGVPRRFGELGPDGRSDLCPQVVCCRCAHVRGSPRLSTGMSTGVEKPPAGRLRPRSRSRPDWQLRPEQIAGKYRAPGRRCVGARTISALWTTQQGHHYRRLQHGGRWRGPIVASRRSAVDSPALLHANALVLTVPLPHRSEEAVARPAPGTIAAMSRALEEAMREENVPAEQPQAEARSTVSACGCGSKAGRAVLHRRRTKGRSRLSA